MKKITLLITCLAVSLTAISQQTISFEASEGFSLGDINTQNGWETTSTGPGTFVTNQEITDAQATDGTYSFKFGNEPAFPGQEGPVVGGFYDFATPIPHSTFTVSFDMLATQQDGTGADFRFGLTGTDGTDGYYVLVVDFNYLGNINVLNAAGDAFQIIGTWTANTWYNVRAEVSETNVTFFVNDVEAGQSVLISNYDIESLRVVHDNYGGDAYVDNIRINDEDLSVIDFSNNTFTHNYNKSIKTLNLESSAAAMTSVEIYSVLGQNVLTKSLNATSESIDLSSLTDGVYLAKVSVDGHSETIKFMKN
ncbi:putative secreted protein (Por secretion system target) [Winogradskyella epiphytica]|uniref:Putative secreted protein (Por secretion system target) n=1 Tax=Winogradskyella epiphytica TaxID=262005 RepID=A0A2V4WVV6_9FLAO|nr:T9SS type A sorting domain-containing protein [Winogradskyella epiphytica]PYE80722.1 putative secreted protein (Por secretion system target) [Winogradskyella epiphytica]GGW67950.1 hypothetical protein GCM10008085_19840 [Winogradskyella epiphytica]